MSARCGRTKKRVHQVVHHPRTIFVDDELVADLDREAENNGKSRSELVREALDITQALDEDGRPGEQQFTLPFFGSMARSFPMVSVTVTGLAAGRSTTTGDFRCSCHGPTRRREPF